MQASVNSQGRRVGVKSSVTFPGFRGDECEDAHEFIRNYKRASRLHGQDDNNLALGLPLYLKGHARAWFKTLPTADEMSFDELSEQLSVIVRENRVGAKDRGRRLTSTF